MKKSIRFGILLLVLFSTPQFINAQNHLLVKGSNGTYGFQEVHDCPGVSAAIILNRIENWARLNFDYYDRLIDESQAIAGVIIKRKLLENGHYNFIVQPKAGKYRVTITNVRSTRLNDQVAFARMEKDIISMTRNLNNFVKHEVHLIHKDW